MTTETKKSRKWGRFFGAFKRAHKKASPELELSQPLLQHLNELRQRLFRAFISLLITTGICFTFAENIIDFLAIPIGGREALVSIDVTENIGIFMKVSLLGGITLGMPFILYQVARFVMPGLNKKEKRWVLLGVPFASLLFVSGVAFTWYVMLPAAVPFLTNFLDITTQIRPSNYFDFITRIMLWIGLCFEMPLIIMILAKMKIVNAKQLLSGWRYAIVGIAIIAAAVTPTIDPVNMGLVMAPLFVLYLISILLAVFAGRD